MKTELRIADHAVIPGQKIVELWHDGLFIGQVAGADGPGVRVISKHPMEVSRAEMVVEVAIKASDPRRN